MQQSVECVGLTDTVTQVQEIIKAGGKIDEATAGGMVGSYFYYFDAYDAEGNLESYEVYGKQALVSTLIGIFTEGGQVDMATLGASGGRLGWIFFGADLPELEDEETPPVDAEGASEASEDESQEETTDVEQPTPQEDVPASPAARDLARAQNIDLNKVTGTGKNGKVNKGDVVKYMEQPQ